MNRNFTLAQRMYQYEGHVRSDQTSANGKPVLLTRAADRTRRQRCSTSS